MSQQEITVIDSGLGSAGPIGESMLYLLVLLTLHGTDLLYFSAQAKLRVVHLKLPGS